ncbi:MAG: RNA 2'-phosphotransferase [Cytophagaceae bacterium]|jgi:putative RNA 2'-phosphotransferase|nr:RNA 2'-phosphotransferase [Cytophagaceae bacterium]
MNEKQATQISRFLSLVLRHKPETIGVQLDEHGWISVEVLLERINAYGKKLTREQLDILVATNPKKRFAYNETLDKIRASQGHSVEVDLGYEAQEPPEFLFHGTEENSINSILKTGLEKRSRHHVHLSKDVETAIKVGQRHGVPIVLEVSAGLMYRAGMQFFQSENGVWLTEFVPPDYLKLYDKK